MRALEQPVGGLRIRFGKVELDRLPRTVVELYPLGLPCLVLSEGKKLLHLSILNDVPHPEAEEIADAQRSKSYVTVMDFLSRPPHHSCDNRKITPLWRGNLTINPRQLMMR